jgi:hypothetical protein
MLARLLCRLTGYMFPPRASYMIRLQLAGSLKCNSIRLESDDGVNRNTFQNQRNLTGYSIPSGLIVLVLVHITFGDSSSTHLEFIRAQLFAGSRTPCILLSA